MNSKNKMQMQLRQFRKKKTLGDDDLGYEEKPPKSHKKPKPKASIEKDRSPDDVSFFIFKLIIIQFSNLSKENENKHSLRTQVSYKHKNIIIL